MTLQIFCSMIGDKEGCSLGTPVYRIVFKGKLPRKVSFRELRARKFFEVRSGMDWVSLS